MTHQAYQGETKKIKFHCLASVATGYKTNQQGWSMRDGGGGGSECWFLTFIERLARLHTTQPTKYLHVTLKKCSSSQPICLINSDIACSAGVSFEHAICSRKCHVDTSQREGEMRQVKGSGRGRGEGRENAVFFLPSPPPFPSFTFAPTVRVTISTLPNLPLS